LQSSWSFIARFELPHKALESELRLSAGIADAIPCRTSQAPDDAMPSLANRSKHCSHKHSP